MAIEAMSTAQAWYLLLEMEESDWDDNDGHAYELVSLLNRRGEPVVIDWALPLLSSDDLELVSLAARVVRQHGCEEGRPFAHLVNPILADRARREADDDVRNELVISLGYSHRPEWAHELMIHANDRYHEVRLSVAANLPSMFDGDEPNDAAIQVLITLSQDLDPHVRDWATMGLGTQIERDSAEIRRALWARVGDDEGVDDGAATEGEAILGLAIRGDEGVFTVLNEWLADDPGEVSNLAVEAAGRLGNPLLLPHLMALRDAGWAEDPLEPRGYLLKESIEELQRRAGP